MSERVTLRRASYVLFKMIILLKKKEAMTEEEFGIYFLDVHAALAKKMSGLRKYVVNIVQRPPNREPDFHGVAELWFDDKEAMKKGFASPEGQATQKDTERFASQVTTLFIEEHTMT